MEPSPSRPPAVPLPSRSRAPIDSIALALLLAVVLGHCVYRAATQSMTHDEALTYANYVAAPPHWLITHFDVNNHLLNSLLCRVSTGCFGVSELTLRLPALLGAALYLSAVYRLARRNLSSRAGCFLAVALLTTCPLVLDYLAIARGYGLAVACLLMGLGLLVDYFTEPSAADFASCDRRLVGASLSLSLAVYANLSCALPAAVLAAGVATFAWRYQRLALPPGDFAASWRRFRCDFVRPALAMAAVLAIFLVKARPRHFYLGEDTLAASLREIVSATVLHHGPPLGFPAGARATEALVTVILVGAIALAAALAIRLVHQLSTWTRSSDLLPPGRQGLLLGMTSGTLVGSWMLWTALHVTLGMKYPCERTGLFAAPLLLIAAVAVVSRPATASRASKGWLRGGCATALWIVLALFVAQGPATYFRTWQYDAASRQVATAIRDAAGERAVGRRVTVLCDWAYQPALEFYFRLWNCDHIDVRTSAADARPDFLVLPHAEREPWLAHSGPSHLVLEDPRSGCVLAAVDRVAGDPAQLAPPKVQDTATAPTPSTTTRR